MKNEKIIREKRNFGQIKKAIGLAKKQHAGQVRKGPDGEAFFNHPRRVCKYYLQYKNKTVPGVLASLCHDLVEDTPVTLEDLEGLFGDEVRQIVLDLTKPAHVSSDDYAARIKGWNQESKKIKLCDIEDNIRSCGLIQRDRRGQMLRRWEKYLKQLQVCLRVGSTEDEEMVLKWNTVNDLHRKEWDRLKMESAG